MSGAEREEILAKLAAIKTAVAELENLLLPERRVFHSFATMACQNPRDIHSEPLFYYGYLDPKDDK